MPCRLVPPGCEPTPADRRRIAGVRVAPDLDVRQCPTDARCIEPSHLAAQLAPVMADAVARAGAASDELLAVSYATSLRPGAVR